MTQTDKDTNSNGEMGKGRFGKWRFGEGRPGALPRGLVVESIRIICCPRIKNPHSLSIRLVCCPRIKNPHSLSTRIICCPRIKNPHSLSIRLTCCPRMKNPHSLRLISCLFFLFLASLQQLIQRHRGTRHGLLIGTPWNLPRS